ncbi:hypothetical protein, partial [Serratia liquefaciens]|uniref:hypothetical protein n=1 Tax=Serratia liquefaciens TaxID=614 RepID=UPI0010206AE1
MKNNEKDVDFSLASDTDRLNFQSATDLNFPVEESSTIELTEHCDNVSKQSDQKVQDLIPSMTPDSNLLA